MTFEDIIADVADRESRSAADAVELAASEAWGALKAAGLRGAEIGDFDPARCAALAAEIWRATPRNVLAMTEDDFAAFIDSASEAIVRAAGLTPLRDAQLEAVR
jgi:hypothetical protein